MTEFFGYDIDSLTAYSVMLLISEFTILLLFKHNSAGWRVRFGSTLLIKTWKVAVGIFSIFVVMFFFGDNLIDLVKDLMEDFEYGELLAISALLTTFVWIWHFVVGKNMNKTMGVMLLIVGILIGIFLWLNFGNNT